MNNVQSPQAANAQARVNAGASWFTAIAGFSVINAIIGMIGLKIHFIIGLALCELIDAFGQGVGGAAGKGVAFVADLIVAGVWVFFASQARKGAKWPFIVGMILYLIDGVFYGIAGDWFPAAFHAYVLFRLFGGLGAVNDLQAVRAQEAMGFSGGYPAGAPGQPGAWPPPPGQAAPPQFGQNPYGQAPPPGAYPPPAGAYPPPAQPTYPVQPPAQPYGQNLDGSSTGPASDWSQPAQPQALPSHWPAPAQPAPSRPAPDTDQPSS